MTIGRPPLADVDAELLLTLAVILMPIIMLFALIGASAMARRNRNLVRAGVFGCVGGFAGIALACGMADLIVQAIPASAGGPGPQGGGDGMYFIFYCIPASFMVGTIIGVYVGALNWSLRVERLQSWIGKKK